MKTKIAAMFALMASLAMAGGLYVVSGADFRPCLVKYVLETTEPNEEVEITPSTAVVLNNYPTGNEPYKGDWSVKTMGEEFTYGPYDNIRFSSPKGGCSNAAPTKFTYPLPGKHLVKLFNIKGNVYQIRMTNNNHIVSASVEWGDVPFASRHSGNAELWFQVCPNLKSLRIAHPIGPNLGRLTGLRDLPAIDDVQIVNPQMYDRIETDAGRECTFTNDMVFVNVTNLGHRAFIKTYKVNYASFPKARRFGQQVFNQGIYNKTVLEQNNWGLKRLRLGDCLEFLGQNSFWGQDTLDVIEFVTSEENWIAAWNNHAIAFGTATAIEGEPNQATLTPISDENYPT